jgi:hypothetical protein
MEDADSYPARTLTYPLSARNDFCVCRVLVDCALVTIESFDNLRTELYASHRPACSECLCRIQQNERAVLGKVVRRTDA